MDIQTLIVYLIVGLAAWHLVRKLMPARKKKKAAASCSACSSCGSADAAPDWATTAPIQKP